ncbi:MAG: CDP-archaeol synthase [Ruminococcaceae bacterium]|nr:CDP-archaeol synthase [Oscillospiraceae bacterium]
MKTRIITSIFALPLIIAALIQPYWQIWGGIAFLASLIGLYEFYKATDIIKHISLCVTGFLACIYFSLSYYFPVSIFPIALWYTALLFLILIFSNNKVSLEKLALSWFGIVYVPHLLNYIVGLRRIEAGGEFYIWLIIVCAFLTDTCAYFTGKAMGKHKLCPKLSPNKTIEGAVGGVVGCGLSCMVFGLIISRYFSADVNFIRLFILGLICSVGAQLGDISASCIKRQYQIKDYGNLFPGHGGVLDRCDSILFVAPLMYYYIRFIGIFN